MLPVARGDGARRSDAGCFVMPWSSSASWRASHMQVLLLMAVSLVGTVSLTSWLWSSMDTTAFTWRGLNFIRVPVAQRRQAVLDAMQFVWTNYRERAFGSDEIAPLTGTGRNMWGGTGCMIIDSLDTLYIMDMMEEFNEGREFVATSVSFEHMGEISVFETIIRNVGGLLSAYDLSKDQLFLTKAVELAQRLLPAIHESTGRADYFLDTTTNRSYQAGQLAESGTYQLEFEYLSAVTGDPTYATYARNFYSHLADQKMLQLDGLFANQIDITETMRSPGSLTISMGARGDSFYEYLLKIWILKGQQPDGYTKKLYFDAVDGMEELLLHESVDGQLYIAEYDILQSRPKHHMHHLACFVPGMLALGAHRIRSSDPDRSRRHMLLAKRLMKTCYEEFYAKQPLGLAPECLETRHLDVCATRHYELRPETVESLYVLYQVTGDRIYQEWGWNIFSSIEKHCRVSYGYAVYRDVTDDVTWEMMRPIYGDEAKGLWDDRLHVNRMHTFFTAETLKYLYLLMDPPNPVVTLDTHVFNTEAHPFSYPVA
ncbi:hypothetical protein Poli38472_002313 [Pythium oligandrum]|uniref:alpha-1,2-Mannosidase n=1 Tax=Pythium oligandrum TaxID=41045 RepID=A0A8K1CJI8_PYTOL|nr:hypothetical protein Poli38472_002313 [Pythium oligandrum]|eukprot:TMW63372.1 hypothetical protein Poli38472_002313 [Pythium oligandrum]